MVTDRSDWSTEDRKNLMDNVYLEIAANPECFSDTDVRSLFNCADWERTHGEIPDGYLETLIKLKNKFVTN